MRSDQPPQTHVRLADDAVYKANQNSFRFPQSTKGFGNVNRAAPGEFRVGAYKPSLRHERILKRHHGKSPQFAVPQRPVSTVTVFLRLPHLREHIVGRVQIRLALPVGNMDQVVDPRNSAQTASTHIATPIPPPMHSVASPFFAPRRFIS